MENFADYDLKDRSNKELLSSKLTRPAALLMVYLTELGEFIYVGGKESLEPIGVRRKIAQHLAQGRYET